MKKRIQFPLRNAVKLIPLKGETNVEVTTTGDVLIKDPAPCNPPRQRSILLAQSIYGKLTSSPGGLNHSVKITFPVEEATRENFLLEVQAIFDNLLLDNSQFS